MSKYIRLLVLPVSLAGALASSACHGGDAAKQDTALNTDLALANRDTATHPQLNDVPAAPAKPAPAAPKPAAPRPKPAPAPAKPAQPATTPSGNTVTTNPRTGGSAKTGTIASGTTMVLASSATVCTNNRAVGDRVTATTNETISGTNGVSIPAGSDVSLEVTRLKRSENAKDPIVMEFRVIAVKVGSRSYPLTASVTDADIARVRDEPKSKDVQKVVGGAVVGGIVGQIIGKNTRGTVTGAAVGAAAGAGAAAATANYQGCINAGNRISIRLDGPVDIVAG